MNVDIGMDKMHTEMRNQNGIQSSGIQSRGLFAFEPTSMLKRQLCLNSPLLLIPVREGGRESIYLLYYRTAVEALVSRFILYSM